VLTGEQTVLGSHEGIATSCIWHVNALFTTSSDGTIACWHTDDPERPPRWVRAKVEIHHAAVDPRGRWFVAGSGPNLIVWPIEGDQPHFVLEGHTDKVRSVSFHPRGAFLLSSDFKGGLLAWGTTNDEIGSQMAQWQPPEGNRIEAIAFDPQGRFFVTACLDGVLIWRMTDADGGMALKVETLVGMEEYATHVAISPDGGIIAAGGYYGHCTAWAEENEFQVPISLGSGIRLPRDPFGSEGFGLLTVSREDPRIDYRSLPQLSRKLQPLVFLGDDTVQPVLFLPDGSIAAGDAAGTLRCWKAGSRQPESIWVNEPGLDLNRVVLSEKGFVVLTAGERFARGRELDRRARLVDMDAQSVDILRPFEEGIYAVALNEDGSILALGGDRSNVIVIIDRSSGARRDLAVEKGATCLALDMGGRWLAAGMGDTICVWDLADGSKFATVETEAAVLEVAFDPSARRLATSHAGGHVHVWELQGGTAVAIAQRTYGGLVSYLNFSDNGNAVVITGHRGFDDGFAVYGRLDADPESWPELELGAANRTMTRIAIDVSPDGAWLVAAGDGGNVARVFKLQEPNAMPTELRGHDQRIRDVAITQDGTRVAIASEDATIHLWDLEHAEPVILSVVNGSAGRIAFRDGQLLAVSESGLHRWCLDLDRLIAIASATASRNLTPEEWRRFLSGSPRATFPELASENND